MNVKVIDNFLADWKKRAYDFYEEQCATYRKNTIAWDKAWGSDSAYSKPYVYDVFPIKKESGSYYDGLTVKQKEAFDKARNFYLAQNKGMWNFIKDYGFSEKYRAEELERKLSKEVATKKANLICRIEKKAGIILDACLYIGVDGNINGTVKGSKDSVSVTTIYAGGYNIQCLHYRILVK